MGCFVVTEFLLTEFLLTSTSRGTSAIAEPLVPIDVVTDLWHLPVLNVMRVSVLGNDVSTITLVKLSVDEASDDNSDDDVVLNADQLPAGNCVSSDTD